MNNLKEMASEEFLLKIKRSLKEIISCDLDANIPFDSINEDVSLYEDGLGLDSISIVKFVVAIEKKFNITFEEGDINAENFGSLNHLSSFLANRVQREGRVDS